MTRAQQEWQKALETVKNTPTVLPEVQAAATAGAVAAVSGNTPVQSLGTFSAQAGRQFGRFSGKSLELQEQIVENTKVIAKKASKGLAFT